MRKFIVPAFAALTLSVAFAAPAAAAEIVTVTVGHADLDLNTEAGKDVLETRVSTAIKTACIKPDTRSLKSAQAWESCKESAASSASEQIEKTIAFASL